MDIYFKIFYEAAWNASIIPFSSDATFAAIKAFGGYNMLLAAVLAVIGATLGMMFNFAFGRLMLRLYRNNRTEKTDYWYNKIAGIFNRYGAVLILFCWVSLMKFILVIAGFLNARVRLVLPLVVVGEIIHYSMYF